MTMPSRSKYRAKLLTFLRRVYPHIVYSINGHTPPTRQALEDHDQIVVYGRPFVGSLTVYEVIPYSSIWNSSHVRAHKQINFYKVRWKLLLSCFAHIYVLCHSNSFRDLSLPICSHNWPISWQRRVTFAESTSLFNDLEGFSLFIKHPLYRN